MSLMSCLPIPKKLKQLPSSTKKAFKSFTSKLTSFSTTAHGRAHGPHLSYYTKKNHYSYHRYRNTVTPSSTRTVGPVEGQRRIRRRRKMRRDVIKVENNNNNNKGEMNKSSNVGWKEYISSLPNITVRGVDERADEFITKFRQQIQLQRDQSLLDFQQMLARTT